MRLQCSSWCLKPWQRGWSAKIVQRRYLWRCWLGLWPEFYPWHLWHAGSGSSMAIKCSHQSIHPGWPSPPSVPAWDCFQDSTAGTSSAEATRDVAVIGRATHPSGGLTWSLRELISPGWLQWPCRHARHPSLSFFWTMLLVIIQHRLHANPGRNHLHCLRMGTQGTKPRTWDLRLPGSSKLCQAVRSALTLAGRKGRNADPGRFWS